MMKILKILTSATIILLLIGVASATDVNNLKCPDNWEATGGGSYHEIGDSPGQGSGQNMIIEKWSDSLKDEFYQNNTDEQYTVIEDGNHTFMYIDDLNQMAGCFEVVEIDNEKYFVDFWTVEYRNSEEIADASYFMVQFNELNNLEPVEV